MDKSMLEQVIDKFNAKMEEKGSYLYAWVEPGEDFGTVLIAEVEDEYLNGKVELPIKTINENKVKELINEFADELDISLWFEKHGDYITVMEG